MSSCSSLKKRRRKRKRLNLQSGGVVCACVSRCRYTDSFICDLTLSENKGGCDSLTSIHRILRGNNFKKLVVVLLNSRLSSLADGKTRCRSVEVVKSRLWEQGRWGLEFLIFPGRRGRLSFQESAPPSESKLLRTTFRASKKLLVRQQLSTVSQVPQKGRSGR